MPRVAAVLSAWGMLATDLRFEVARTHIGDTRALDGGAVKRLFAEMEAEGSGAAARLVRRAGADDARSVDMRYGEQVFEIAVPLDEVDWAQADPLPQIVERFHRRHEELYTYSLPDQETVLVNARVAVSGLLSALPQEPALPESAADRTPRPPPDLSRRVAADPGLRFRRAGPGPNDPRARIDRIGDDDGLAAARRHGDGHSAGLARYRAAGAMSST